MLLLDNRLFQLGPCLVVLGCSGATTHGGGEDIPFQPTSDELREVGDRGNAIPHTDARQEVTADAMPSVAEPNRPELPSGDESPSVGLFDMDSSGPSYVTEEELPLVVEPPEPSACNPTLTGIVRDFRPAGTPGGHSDFEAPFASDTELPGIVMPSLGADRKPIYALAGPAYHPQFGQMTHGPDEFDQWYRDVPAVNQAMIVELPLTAGPDEFTHCQPILVR